MSAFCVLGLLLLLCGCAGPAPRPGGPPQLLEPHPSFLTRVSDDCREGEQWACDLLMSLAHAEQSQGR